MPDWLPPAVSVHRGDWKLIRIFHGGENGAHRHLLFNLRDDLGEKNNLAAQKPELVARTRRAHRASSWPTPRPSCPIPNPAFDPAKYHPELEGKARDRSKGKAGAKAAPAARGWQASAHARLEWRDGILHFTSTGGDPWISKRDLGDARRGPFTLHLEMSSTARGPALVYFNTSANQAFAKERSRPFPVIHDGAFHEYEVRIETPALPALRLDPAQAPGEIVIRRLELRDAMGRAQSLLEP